MVFSLCRVQQSRFDQPRNVGMIAREPRNGIPAHQIQAAVPDMGKVEARANNAGSRTSGSHAVELGMLGSVVENGVMGGAQAITQGGLRVGSIIPLVDGTDSGNGDLAGLLATLVSAHAVGHDGEPSSFQEFRVALRLPIGERILVALA